MFFLCMRRWIVLRDARATPAGAHLQWIQQQHNQGTILLSGPSPDLEGALYLVRAESKATAEAVAAADPYTAYGDATFEVFHWDIHQALGIGPFTPTALAVEREENAKAAPVRP